MNFEFNRDLECIFAFVIEINCSFVIKFRFALPLSRQLVPLKLTVPIQGTIVERLLADQHRQRVARDRRKKFNKADEK